MYFSGIGINYANIGINYASSPTGLQELAPEQLDYQQGFQEQLNLLNINSLDPCLYNEQLHLIHDSDHADQLAKFVENL